VSVPYTVEINDVLISAVQQQPSDEILRRGRDHFDRLLHRRRQGAARHGDSVASRSMGCNPRALAFK
jgi:hypothetical protein